MVNESLILHLHITYLISSKLLPLPVTSRHIRISGFTLLTLGIYLSRPIHCRVVTFIETRRAEKVLKSSLNGYLVSAMTAKLNVKEIKPG